MCHMNERRNATDRVDAADGVDAGALGMDEPPESAPPGATVEDAEHLVPGPAFGDHVADEAKPWFTSLAAESDQAGVANDAPDAQEPQFPTSDEDPR